jgi:hypothetical protein
MSCTHEERRDVWIDGTDFEEGHWEKQVTRLTEDIDTGRYRCTRCGEVMYYTGSWRAIHEGGR